jgi:RNA polymerase sigma-70 factor (ECF subfamily)
MLTVCTLERSSLSYSNSPERALPVSLLLSMEESQTVAVPDSTETRSASDEALLETLKSKDRESLAELFRRYSRLVFSIAFRILQDAGEAEDIVQEIFLFLYERAEKFDEHRGEAKAWIVQVAYHRSMDRQKYLHRRNFYFGTDMEALADTLQGTDDVERDLASKLSREQLQKAFEELSDRQRLTLELFFFEGLDFREIAERSDESLENVRHHYYRGLQKLRKDAFVKKLKDKKQS